MVTGVGNATLYQGNLVKGYLIITKKPGVRPISIPHPLGWAGPTQFYFLLSHNYNFIFWHVGNNKYQFSIFLCMNAVSYTHLRAHETGRNLVCRLLLEKKKK